MMGSEKDQVEMPKAVATGDQGLCDNLRLQKYKDKDEIHIHDDKDDLTFVYEGQRAFQLGMDTFIKDQHVYGPGDRCVIIGKAGSKRADLVLERTLTQWKMYLKPVGKPNDPIINTFGTDHILCDKVIIALDEFVQRI